MQPTKDKITTKKQELKAVDDNDKLNEISQDIGVVYSAIENDVVLTINQSINKGAEKGFENWKRLHQGNQQSVLNEIKRKVANGEKATDKILKGAKKIIGIEEKDVSLPNTEKGNMLITSAMSHYNRAIVNIERLSSVDDLKKSIYEQTKLGIENGIKVVYKDNKVFRYKTYMEMNVRTTLANEVAQKQLKYGGNAGVVFYLYNTLADCAKDHQDYQGQYYYDARWETFEIDSETKAKVSDYISSNSLISIQEVESAPIYLGTRPNCRHKKISVGIEQVLNNSADKLGFELGMTEGGFDKDKHLITQQFRKGERNIREYKERKLQYEALAEKDPTNEYYQNAVKKNERLVKRWQRNNIILKAENKYLVRDKRREDTRILVDDLGAKYNI